MRKLLAGLIAPLGVALLFGFNPSASRGDSVSFYTEAFFTSDGSSNGSLSGGSAYGTSGDYSSISFEDGNSITVEGTSDIAGTAGSAVTVSFVSGFANTSFGQFLYSGTNGTSDYADDASLTIDIFQTATSPPAGGGGMGSGDLVGSVTGSMNDSRAGDLSLLFTNYTITLPSPSGGFPPNVIYSFPGNQPGSPGEFDAFVHPNNSISIAGTVAEAPLPMTLWSGAVLLGGVWFVYASKKFRSVK